MMNIIIAFIFGTAITSVVALLLFRRLQEEKADLRTQLTTAQNTLELHKQHEEQAQRERELREQQAQAERAEREQQAKAEREAYAAQQMQLLREQFETASQRLLKQRAEELQKANTDSVGGIVNPLHDELEKMRKLITDTKTDSDKSISSLEGALATMVRQSQQLGKDATNLADALKNRGKVHGDWGEQVLENILQDSGMREGYEYVSQASFKGEQGRELRPDVVVNCADGARIIIDSKVSLTAYTNYVGAENEIERVDAIKQNHQSILKHIKELSEKNYPKYVEGSIPYSLMFIPNEGSYILAMNYDPSLGNKAFKQGVILLNPTNLMMALFLVLQTWRNTQQEDNCRKIIEVATGLYDKFVGLYSTCDTLGNQLATVNTTYKKVLTQLNDGSGNIVGRVERLIELGVPSAKRIQRKTNRSATAELAE